MASYHNSFSYLEKNSAEEGFILASFEPDNGEVETGLSMEQIYTDSYDGVKKYFYGNRYNAQPIISMTLIKMDGTEFSVADNRKVFKWLTGNRNASWLDFYEGDTFVYSFYGSFTNSYQYKIDAKVVGIRMEFTSLYPWAWSNLQTYTNVQVGQAMLEINNDGVLYKGGSDPFLGIDENGILFNDSVTPTIPFNQLSSGVIYNDSTVILSLPNPSDDLYTYTDLDIVYTAKNNSDLSIKNETLGEETLILGLTSGETIHISSGKFIVSDKPHKIFGDTFNFVWPRLCPGNNEIIVHTIDGTGQGEFTFSYRYPIKIGDCAVDINNLIPQCVAR